MDKVKDMPTSFNDKAVEIVMDNKLGYERVAMACAASFAKMMGFSDERIEDLKTVVAEAAINAMQHGNKDRQQRSPGCKGGRILEFQG
jgi:serine/threonine-protein kinase RsbW